MARHVGQLSIAAAVLALASLAHGAVGTVVLKPQTAQAFDAYMRSAEARLESQGAQGLLWVDGSAERKRAVREGKVLAEPWSAKGEIGVPDGLVHDWVGACFIPGATLDRALAFVQDYDNHKLVYKPEVVDSKLLERRGDEFAIYLRLVKKKVLTVTLNTRHDVRYFRVAPDRAYSRSYTSRIAEVADAGEPGERELPPGSDHGFLWRLNSFWRFQERDGGVWLECEAISLTRDVPSGLGWLINPIIRGLPRESLENTLRATRDALLRTSPPAAR